MQSNPSWQPADRQRTISLFTEDRYGTDLDGRWAAVEDHDPHAWSRYQRQAATLRMVVRADPRLGSASVRLDDDVEVEPLPYYIGLRAMLRTFPRLVLAVARAVQRSDTIILRTPGTISTIAALVCRLTGRRYAVEVVGDPADVLMAGVLGTTGRRLAPIAARGMRGIVRGASSSLFVTRHSLQTRYPPNRHTPSSGVTDVHLHDAAVRQLPREWTPPPFTVLAIGSQEQHYKGHDVLLRAIAVLVDEGIQVNGAIVGGGRAHDEIVALAHELEIADRVLFTGRLADRRRIIELLDAASLFAMPSRTEGLPRALLEAMARALPCVGSDVGGIPELLDRRHLVPPGDHLALARSMKDLMMSPELWRQQSRRNLEVARGFRTERIDQLFDTWLATVPPVRSCQQQPVGPRRRARPLKGRA